MNTVTREVHNGIRLSGDEKSRKNTSATPAIFLFRSLLDEQESILTSRSWLLTGGFEIYTEFRLYGREVVKVPCYQRRELACGRIAALYASANTSHILSWLANHRAKESIASGKALILKAFSPLPVAEDR